MTESAPDSDSAASGSDVGARGGSASRRRERRGRLRVVLLAAIGALYLVSVPWYRAADADPPLFLGLPSWVGIALCCYAAAAVLNAAAWLLTDVPDEPRRDEYGELGGPGS